MTVGEGKNQELTREQRGSEKSGRTDCISEFRRVRGKVRGHGSQALIRTFRPEAPSMTQQQRVLQGRPSLQLIVHAPHPSTLIISPSIRPPIPRPPPQQPIYSAGKPNILG